MADKVFKTRIQMKNNTTEYWDSVQNSFIPLFGEIIIYSDKDAEGNLLPAKMKIGDGETILIILDEDEKNERQIVISTFLMI